MAPKKQRSNAAIENGNGTILAAEIYCL